MVDSRALIGVSGISKKQKMIGARQLVRNHEPVLTLPQDLIFGHNFF
jgi:hypothetical protein